MAALVGPETLIAIKLNYEGANRRFKLPLKDLGAYTFPQKIRQILCLPTDSNFTLERYSDSAAKWIVLDSENPAIYKQLYRAAKAKTKLRIKLTEDKHEPEPEQKPALESFSESTVSPASRGSYLNTVLNDPVPARDGTRPRIAKRQAPQMNDIGELPQLQLAEPNAWIIDTSVPSKTRDNPTFYIDCNNCGDSIPNAHWHCSICDNGDYDLCQKCIDDGVLCPGEDHWLIKRSVVDGAVVNSTTETIAPKAQEQPTEDSTEEGSLETVEEEPEVEQDEQEPEMAMRTCNTCFQDYDEAELVTCFDCNDYDLCFSCMVENTHGHHPGHNFNFIQDVGTSNLKDKRICGVRHKCLDCPDYDLCSNCVDSAPSKHIGHRFVPLYKPIAIAPGVQETHYGIYCDGPLCNDRCSFITGIRYKCAICHDTDFCSNCEAHPENNHNHTHPLLKFKTAVRHVSISTVGENEQGQPLQRMGDRSLAPTKAVGVSHAATQVQKSSDLPAPPSPASSATINEEKENHEAEKNETQPWTASFSSPEYLQARFVKDIVADGTEFLPNTVFKQTWYLQNFGPRPWPRGCSIRFAGGDAMFNVDTDHPTSTSQLISAMESNELPRDVMPNEIVPFTLTLKTPCRLGRAISYWRLKTADGIPFGDRLWCDVVVRSAVSQSRGDSAEQEFGSVQGYFDGQDETQEKNGAEPLAESGMVFPKLDKESPESSIVETPEPASTTAKDVEHDIADDVESLTMDDADSDGFLTDEEYDILDASDEEFATGAQKREQK
ncbi:predicted protein [Uncinocarpus reesii 1704]|uniref:ZZ-type domain-containing protein n=1 Tax=Uncinocarpus reesii (strain UAMH 1704) TaxID=336963 RepID=C4JWJ2_UNCRE|nr:uncharacterized protein UREG_06934 [Uncinocarpus reesii 1704]EEP82069.1 predicted protein [Uncinocarpus reesii 1704]